ncbi:DMT family transporter [Ochrobactrum soli]|uniref:Permease of the drug/metabolite transporter (DMT) superfamily n=1 Tax=Ochrobactrum soli TaxID=2448455 RepID=A0A2P9HEA2_9HYPH|nr:DMT family transporter [[Ochrobactrum] soli]SPL62419.1 Permease of the drug/metabolite transporter (DMT) superfamily [[Ochrobactrum] soli]
MSVDVAFKRPRGRTHGNSYFGSLRNKRQSLIPIVALVVAILLWGTNWPVMKVGLHHVTPIWFSALRFGTGALTLFAVQAVRGGIHLPERGDFPFIASIGLLQMTAFTVLGALAMTHLPAGRSAILSYTTPLWVAPAAVLFFGQRLSRNSIVGIAVAAVGVAILVNPEAINWSDPVILSSNMMLIVASMCWAACILHLRYFKSPSSAFALAPWQMVASTVVLIPLAWIVEGNFTADNTITFFETTLFVGPIATAFCFVAVNTASSWLPATTMSTAMLGVPVTGVALSILFLGESLTSTLAIGTLAIIAGIILNTIPPNKAPKIEG